MKAYSNWTSFLAVFLSGIGVGMEILNQQEPSSIKVLITALLAIAVTLANTTYVKRLLPKWEYGTFGPNKQLARRSTATGAVQFILWESGKNGRKDNIWYRSDSSFWPSFEPYENNKKESE